jgi:hypothetical protein
MDETSESAGKAAARAILYATVTVTEPGTGARIEKETETSLYRAYLQNQEAYRSAREKYLQEFESAQASELGRRMWPLRAATLQIPVKAAYDRWRSQDAARVEAALAIMTEQPSRPNKPGS